MKRQLTLKSFLWWLTGLSALPLLALAIYLAYVYVETRHDEAEGDAALRASNFATVIENRLGAQVAGLQMLAASPSLADPSRFGEFYVEAQSYRSYFRGHVILADPSLQMIANTRSPYGTALPRLPAPRGGGPSAALAALASGKPTISDIVDGPVAHEPLVAIAVPVMREGKPIYLLLATIETAQFQAEIDKMAISEAWTLALLDGRGGTIAHSSAVAASTGAKAEPRKIVHRVAMTSWRVVMEIPPEVWRAPTVAAAMAVLAMLVAAIIASLMVGRQASRLLLRAVSSLAHARETTTAPPLAVTEIEQVRAKMDGAAVSLRESEARYRALFDNHHTVMLLVDPGTGAIVDVNPAAERFYGSTRRQLAAMSIFDLNTLAPEQIRAEMQRAAQVVRNDFHFRHRAAGGQVRDVNVLACPVAIEGKKLLFAIIHDETERVRADEALRETASLLQMASKLARFGGWSVDLAEGTVLWSDEVAAIHEMPQGYSPKVHEGVSFYAPEWRDKIRERFDACARDGTPYDEEMEIITARGRRIWVRTLGQAIRDDSGRIIRAQGAFQDITEAKQVERALIESERRYRALFENMTAGFVLFEVVQDGRGVPVDLLIVAANKGFEATTGLRSEDVTGKRLTHVLPGIERDDADWIGTYGTVALTGESRQFEQYSEHLGIHYSVTAYQGGAGMCAVTFVDVTERKRSEDEVRRLHSELERHAADLEQRVAERTAELEAAKVRAEAADRVKSAFLATMSHELRTPLNSIIGFTGVLLQRLPGPLNTEQEEQLNIVRSASRHLLLLISDVLDISKVEAGELRLAHEPFDLRGLLERVSAAFSRESEHRRLSFSLRMDARQALVTGDERRVEQVLNNLLSNALKFTPHGSITVALTRDHEAFTVTITDTGVGIRREDLGKLFRAFSQIETGLPGIREGTGLGLAISRHLVEAMGGHISVESEWGQGSRFAFTLPAGAGT